MHRNPFCRLPWYGGDGRGLVIVSPISLSRCPLSVLPQGAEMSGRFSPRCPPAAWSPHCAGCPRWHDRCICPASPSAACPLEVGCVALDCLLGLHVNLVKKSVNDGAATRMRLCAERWEEGVTCYWALPDAAWLSRVRMYVHKPAGGVSAWRGCLPNISCSELNCRCPPHRPFRMSKMSSEPPDLPKKTTPARTKLAWARLAWKRAGNACAVLLWVDGPGDLNCNKPQTGRRPRWVSISVFSRQGA